jgi:hypothetical protein
LLTFINISTLKGATKLISRSLAITNVEQYGPDTTYDIDMKKARFRGNRYEVVLELVNGKVRTPGHALTSNKGGRP